MGSQPDPAAWDVIGFDGLERSVHPRYLEVNGELSSGDWLGVFGFWFGWVVRRYRAELAKGAGFI